MTTKELTRKITVGSDSDCDFRTIKEALHSIPEFNKTPITIFIKKGIYEEKLEITTPYVTLVGEDKEDTLITFGDYAKMKFPDGSLIRTFNTYTVFVGADDIIIQNLTIKNNAGLGEKVGQAVALYVEGSRVRVEDVRLLANQDTLFTGPLPHKPVEGNDFGGPMEGKQRIVGKQYYKNCYIEGDIDFIFGSATAVFEHCELFSKDLGKQVNGYVTAASTYEGQEFGYVFIDCKFTSDAKAETVYLGRPWRDYAKTVLIHCEIGEHIHKEGWNDWNKELARKVAFYGEYASYTHEQKPVDCSSRVAWSHILNEEEASKYTLLNVLGPGEWYN
ncbi:MAG: pectinesterase family protein [bacterium]|nr:pectinesterase family protein [bacterium]